MTSDKGAKRGGRGSALSCLIASLEGGLGSTSPPAAMSCLSGLESFSVYSTYRTCLLLRGGSVAGIAPIVAIMFVLLAGADAIDCVCRSVRRCIAVFSDAVEVAS